VGDGWPVVTLATEMIVRVTELPTASTYLLTVVEVVDPGPRVRRITVTGAGLASLNALPGQDVVVHLPDGNGGGLSRRYTIRHLDTAQRTLDLDVVRHGHGPGARWAEAVQVGDAIEVFGPRGKVRLAGAHWQLFAGDESALPGIAEMVAALPADTTARVIVEVEDAADHEPMPTPAQLDVQWLHRDGVAPGQSELLDRALDALDLPDADRHAYLFAESRVVRRLRDLLARRGVSATEISAKGYWNIGR
jgi:NADPH-dependent ferric siderophore reductase